MAHNMGITFGMLGVFYVIIIVTLYKTYKKDATFTGYAVGGRSFSAPFVAMSYTNSWWPGATFIAYVGLTIASGVVGFYALLYSLLGLTAMYLMARHAWSWGKQYNLRTQPDMIGLRYDSRTLKLVASAVGVISLFPWIVLGMQSLGDIFRIASFNHLSIVTALIIGMALIVIRQYWTVRMGMRGLVYTDMIQGIVAYVLTALFSLGILVFFFHGFGSLRTLPTSLLELPGATTGGPGPWYLFSIIFTGIVGSMCWPTSYQRIYTAKNIQSVKMATLLTFPISGVFYTLLTLVALVSISLPIVAKTAASESGWFVLLGRVAGSWGIGFAVLAVFAASMGWIDGCVQVCGTQIANDIVGGYRKLSDVRLTVIAKASMITYMGAGAIVAYLTFNYTHLINLAIMAYQGVIQLSVPIFFGLWWRGGNKQGAMGGLIAGFVVAAALTYAYPSSIPWLGGMTAGLVGLAVNLLVFFGGAVIFGQSDAERSRVHELFDDEDDDVSLSV